MTKIKRRNLLTEKGLVKLGAVLSPRLSNTQANNPEKEAKVLTARYKHQFATTWCNCIYTIFVGWSVIDPSFSRIAFGEMVCLEH